MTPPPRVQRGRVIAQLPELNPWWRGPERWVQNDPQLLDAERAPFAYAPTVLADAGPPNLYTLRGPRRVGKSTVLKQTVGRLIREGVDPRQICYFSADALSTFQDLVTAFQAARELFPDLAERPRYFLVDEVSAIPEWQRALKWLRDNTRVRGDCVIATGSSARDIAAGSADLAGRRGPDVGLDRLLLPLSFPEFVRCAGYDAPDPPRVPYETFFRPEGRRAVQETLVHLGTLSAAFEAYLLAGGFPQAVADFRRSAQVSDGFARDLWEVVRSDVRSLGVSRPEQALRLMERVAAGLSSTVSLTALGEALDVSYQTAGSWLDALADAFLLMLLYQERDGLPDLRRQRKVYPIDPFLVQLPAKLEGRTTEARGPAPSALVEAVVATTIFRAVEPEAVERFGAPGRVFLFRTRDGAEVDFVVQPGALAAECKYADAVSSKDTRTLRSHFSRGLVLTRTVIDPGDSADAGAPEIHVVPTALFAWMLAGA